MSRSHQFSDYEAPLSKSNSDLESVLTSCGEETDSHLHLPQTPLKSSNSNISDGIIREQVAIGPGRSEKFPHSRSQSIRVNDSTSYLPDLGRQISRMDSNDNDIRSRLRDEDVESNSNIVYNPRRRPQTAQPISHTSMRRQSPSGSNMGSGAPPRSAIFNRLRPATASAIRYTENSVLRTRLDQVKALCEAEVRGPSSDAPSCSESLPSVINRHPQAEDSVILDPLSSFSPTFDHSNQSNRNMIIETSTLFLGDETQPDSNDVQRWDKIRGNRASKYGKSPMNISPTAVSPKYITKHRTGDRKVMKMKNNSAERDNGRNDSKLSKFHYQSGIERTGSKGISSSSSPKSTLIAARQEVPATPASPPFTSYITVEYVTPVGVCSEEWRGLQMALRGSALDIQHTDLRDLVHGNIGDALETAVGYLCVLFNVEPNLKKARSTVLRGTAPLLRFLREADPATVPPPLLLEASSFWGQRNGSLLSGKEQIESQSSIGKLCRWIQYFDTMSQLLKSARDSGSDSGQMRETQVQTIHPASPRLSERVCGGSRRDGMRYEPIVIEDNGEGWIEEIDGVWQGDGRDGRDHPDNEQYTNRLPSVRTSSHRTPSLRASHSERQSILDDANDYCDNIIAGRERERGSGREREEKRDSQKSLDLKPILSEKNKLYMTKMKLFSMYQPEKKRRSSKTANAGTRNIDGRKSQNSVARLSSGSGDVLDYFREMGFDESAGFDMLVEAEVPRMEGDSTKCSRQGTPGTGSLRNGRSRDSGRDSGRGRSYVTAMSNEDGTDLELVLGLDPGQGNGQRVPVYSESDGLHSRDGRYGSPTVCESTEQQRYLDFDTDTEVYYRTQKDSPQGQGRRGKNTVHSAYAPSKYDATHTPTWSQTAHAPGRVDVTSRYALSASVPIKQLERQCVLPKRAVSPIQKRHMHVGAAGAADNLDYYKSARKRRISTERALKKSIAASLAIASARAKSALLYPTKSQDRALSSYGLFFEHVWCSTGSDSIAASTDGGAGGGVYYASPEDKTQALYATETKASALPTIAEVKAIRMTSQTLNKLSRPKGSWISPLGTETVVGTANPTSDPSRIGSGRASRTLIPSFAAESVETAPSDDVLSYERSVTLTNAEDVERDEVLDTVVDVEAAEEDGEEYYEEDAEIEIETMAVAETIALTVTEGEIETETEVVIVPNTSIEGSVHAHAVDVVMAAGDVETVDIEEAQSPLTGDGNEVVKEEDVDVKSHKLIAEKDDYDNDFEDEVEVEVEVEVEEFEEDEGGADAEADGEGEMEGEGEVEADGEVEAEGEEETEGEVEGEVGEGRETEESDHTVSVTGETLTDDPASFRAYTEKQYSESDSYSNTCADSETDSTSHRTGPSKGQTEGRDGSMSDITIPYNAENVDSYEAVGEHVESSICKTADSNLNPCTVFDDIFQTAFVDVTVDTVEIDMALSNPSLAA